MKKCHLQSLWKPGWNPSKPHAEGAPAVVKRHAVVTNHSKILPYLRFHDMTPAKIIFKVDTCACAKVGYQDARIGYDFAY